MVQFLAPETDVTGERKFMRITRHPQEEEDNCQKERDNEGFMEWRAWQERDRTRRLEEDRLKNEAARRKASWALYRECSRLVDENHARWLERKIAEDTRRLEEEKASRLAEGKLKRTKLLKKMEDKKKKETKPEATRRLEEKKNKKGRSG